MSISSVVTIQNLNHYFYQSSLRQKVLFDINLEFLAREIVIMTSPSGSGKTTLLTLIGGLRSVQEGSLRVLNQELCGASKKKRRKSVARLVIFSRLTICCGA